MPETPPRWYQIDLAVPLCVNVAALVLVLVLWLAYQLLILALVIAIVNIVLLLLLLIRRWRQLQHLWEQNHHEDPFRRSDR